MLLRHKLTDYSINVGEQQIHHYFVNLEHVGLKNQVIIKYTSIRKELEDAVPGLLPN